MTSMAFVACSSSDDNPVQPQPTPTPPTPESPLAGTWSLVNDVDRSVVTELVVSTDPIQDYSATNTSVNPTIPAGTPTYSLVMKTDPSVVDPWAGGTTSFAKEVGYVTTAAGGKVTFWPQSVMSSTDGTNWMATPKADMTNHQDYTYQINGNVLILTRGDNTTQTFISKVATPTVAATVSVFFNTWLQPSDAAPNTKVELVMSSLPYVDYGNTGTGTNPTIPANTPSYTKTTSVNVGTLDPWVSPTSYTKDMGYFTLPGVASMDGTTSIPSTGKIVFWLQKQMTSTDGSAWTEVPAADIPVKMEEYTYTLNGNVMVLTKGDKTTQTYYTILTVLQ